MKACSHPLQKEDCAAKEFIWSGPTSIPEPTGSHPSVVAKGMSASHPHQPLSPPPVRLPSPRRPISGQHGPPQAGLFDARCQLPEARGRLLTGQPPQLQRQVYPKHFNLYAFTGKLRSCLTCWFNAFCLQMDVGVEELCIGTMNRSRTPPLSSPRAIGWRAKQGQT